MANIGIWMDKRMAKLITIGNGEEQPITIKSNVEDYRPSGGSGNRLRGGLQNVVHDRRYKEREKQQLKAYFVEIANKLPKDSTIVVFGPAETGKRFVDELSKSHKELRRKIIGVEKADSMTDNQMKAWVIDYFRQKQN